MSIALTDIMGWRTDGSAVLFLEELGCKGAAKQREESRYNQKESSHVQFLLVADNETKHVVLKRASANFGRVPGNTMYDMAKGVIGRGVLLKRRREVAVRLEHVFWVRHLIV